MASWSLLASRTVQRNLYSVIVSIYLFTVEKYGHWSVCTKTCGGGTRYREGKCSGRRCKKVLRLLEPCSPQPCVTEQPDPGNPATSPQPPTACKIIFS